MNRRYTIAELRWPTNPEFSAVAKTWSTDASLKMLETVWAAYDGLLRTILSSINISQAEDELERSISFYLSLEINKLLTGDEFYQVAHEPWEFESRRPAPARSKQYDIAFVLNSNYRIMWPLEAKVLRDDSAVAEYVSDIKTEFLLCRYAPFSEEGAMLGYLLSGTSRMAFRNIAKSLPCKLRIPKRLYSRPHRISRHLRVAPKGKPYPRRFRIHHLMFVIQPTQT